MDDSKPPSYDEAAGAYNTAQTVKSESESGFLDQQYYKSPWKVAPKTIEVLCSLIAYICVEVSSVGCVWASATIGYFKFISMAAFVSTLILWILLLFKIPQRILKCDCVNWPFVEMAYYFGIIIFYFFGDLFLAIQNCGSGGLKAGCAFGFFALFAYGFDGGMAALNWWRVRKEIRSNAKEASNEEAKY